MCAFIPTLILYVSSSWCYMMRIFPIEFVKVQMFVACSEVPRRDRISVPWREDWQLQMHDEDYLIRTTGRRESAHVLYWCRYCWHPHQIDTENARRTTLIENQPNNSDHGFHVQRKFDWWAYNSRAMSNLDWYTLLIECKTLGVVGYEDFNGSKQWNRCSIGQLVYV